MKPLTLYAIGRVLFGVAALAAPRPVSFVKPAERATKELARLKEWYATWGVDFNPLP